MTSQALSNFEHAIQDAQDLFNHFDALNSQPPPPQAEVLKRASLVMALAALETYVEDRIVEATNSVAGDEPSAGRLAKFYKTSLENDLKYFHTPSTDRVQNLFRKYLDVDITEGWKWNHFEPTKAKAELTRIAKKRGDISHRSLRPRAGEPARHAVTRDDLRRNISFIRSLVKATDKYLNLKLPNNAAP